MQPKDKYYRWYPIISPAYNCARIAGKHIQDRASRYFTGKMIEIGCGTKAKALLVGEYVDEHIGLDIKTAQHGQSNIDLLGSAYNIPVDHESFDCVLSTAVLEHLEEPQKALNEAFRILKLGGYAIYTIPLFWHLHEEPRDFYRYTKHGIKYLFEKAGFEIVELKPLSGFWITFGSELNYYLSSFLRGSFRFVFNPIIALNNVMCLMLDEFDRRFHPATEKWTWMYMIVVRKK